MNKQKELGLRKQRREFHVRNQLRGDAQRPRMCVFRSSTHVGCQLIDDIAGVTLVSASTRDKELRDQIKYGGNCDAAKIIGQKVAEKALAAGIQAVRFDRGGFKYHGRVAALADAARAAGLSF